MPKQGACALLRQMRLGRCQHAPDCGQPCCPPFSHRRRRHRWQPVPKVPRACQCRSLALEASRNDHPAPGPQRLAKGRQPRPLFHGSLQIVKPYHFHTRPDSQSQSPDGPASLRGHGRGGAMSHCLRCPGSPSMALNLPQDSKQIFRFDTFGDEAKWTDHLRMHEVIASSAVGSFV